MPHEATLGVIVAVVGLLGSLMAAVRTFYAWGERVGKLEVKVDTIWDWTLKSLQVAARQHGVLAERSPLSIDPQVLAQFRLVGLDHELQRYYWKHSLSNVSESELKLMLARTFGDDLMQKICLPLEASRHVTLGDALLVAAYLCRVEGH